MTETTALWVDKTDISKTTIARAPAPEPGPGEIVARIERFALTANNVSYAKTGEALGYWRFFPAEAPWGVAPVWGFAEVTAANDAPIAIGERLYGFFPMASHIRLLPSAVREAQFMDGAAHRADLPPLYNLYRRTAAEPAALSGHEDARCLYFPLFMTSYLLLDYLIDNDWFGAERVVIGSASSKTGFGLAKLIAAARNTRQDAPQVIGVTGAGNVEFVRALGCCDQVIRYEEADALPADSPAVYVDMSGAGALTEALHRRLGDALKASIAVGATHWQASGPPKDLPGPRPAFFFAPAQMQKRDADWGPGVLIGKATEAALQLSGEMADAITVTRLETGPALQQAWSDLLANKIPPSRGLIAAL